MTTTAPRTSVRIGPALGPAFVAAVAYVDPGNVAANITAGSRYGTLLLWVLVLANLIAVAVQYQAAKLGIVTGRSLPQVMAGRLRRPARLAYWGQAELVAAATDVAEVVGGAVALHLLFGLHPAIGGLVVGAVSLGMLATRDRFGQRHFEAVVVALLVTIAVGFSLGLVLAPPGAGDVLAGLVPRFAGTDTVLLAASMMGATVMPHAVYVHSALARDRAMAARSVARAVEASSDARGDAAADATTTPWLLKAAKVDVGSALVIAGLVNIALLLLAASALRGVDGTDSIEGAHAAIGAALGPVVAAVFAVGLLASGLASTSVGSHAGAEVMAGLLQRRVPVVVRRLVTIAPAIALLAVGADATTTLVLSQVVLSFGIPFALVPLLRVGRDAGLLGGYTNPRWLQRALALAIGAVVTLNLVLLVLVLAGG